LVVAAFLGDDKERDAKKGIYYARFTGKREGSAHRSPTTAFTRGRRKKKEEEGRGRKLTLHVLLVRSIDCVHAGDRIGVFLAPEERAEEMVNAVSVFPFTDDMKVLLLDVNKMERLVEDPTKSLSKDLNEKYLPPSRPVCVCVWCVCVVCVCVVCACACVECLLCTN
jgi:hypothetical protein